MAFRGNIEKLTVKNTYYRKVLSTTSTMQLVLMSLCPDEEIGREKHSHTTQFIRVEAGRAKAIIGNKKYFLKDGDAIVIPPNTWHNVINTGKKDLKLYTLYAPPEHPPGTKERYRRQEEED